MTWMLGLVLISSLDLSGGETTTVCSSDAVAVGSVCVDKYEASVWQVPQPMTSNKGLVAKLKKGTATLEDLLSAGATQLGCETSPFNLAPFPERVRHQALVDDPDHFLAVGHLEQEVGRLLVVPDGPDRDLAIEAKAPLLGRALGRGQLGDGHH